MNKASLSDWVFKNLEIILRRDLHRLGEAQPPLIAMMTKW